MGEESSKCLWKFALRKNCSNSIFCTKINFKLLATFYEYFEVVLNIHPAFSSE